MTLTNEPTAHETLVRADRINPGDLYQSRRDIAAVASITRETMAGKTVVSFTDPETGYAGGVLVWRSDLMIPVLTFGPTAQEVTDALVALEADQDDDEPTMASVTAAAVADFITHGRKRALVVQLADAVTGYYRTSRYWTGIGRATIKPNPYLNHECQPCTRSYCGGNGGERNDEHCDRCYYEVRAHCGHEGHTTVALADIQYGKDAATSLGVAECGHVAIWAD